MFHHTSDVYLPMNGHQSDMDQDLMTQLRILSSIRPQDTISTNNTTKPLIRIQKPGVRRSVYRFYMSECRAVNLAYIQQLLNRVQDRFLCGRRLKDAELCRRLSTETAGAIRGLRNLQATYEDDAQFQAGINVAIETAQHQMDLQEMPSPYMERPPAEGSRAAHQPTAVGSEYYAESTDEEME
jgi:hypothetical protein